MSTGILERLTGGDPRFLGEVDLIVTEVHRRPELLVDLVACLKSPDELVQARTANALKKIAAFDPTPLQPFAAPILKAWRSAHPLTAQWNLTLVVGKLELKPKQRALAHDLLFEGLSSKSSLQRTFSMQALTDLAAQDPSLRERLVPLLDRLTTVGTAAMQARGRKLLRQLGSGKRRDKPAK